MGNSVIAVRRLAGGFMSVAGHPYARNLPFLAVGLWFAWLLVGQMQGFDLSEVLASFFGISTAQWLGALLATGISFLGVAGYDVVTTRALGFNLSKRDGLRMGFVATSLAQLVGLGLASGSLARWRMLGGAQYSLWQASVLTIAVTTGFLSIAAVFAAFSTLFWLPMPRLWQWAAVGVLLAFGGALILSIWRPRWQLFGRALAWPKLKTILHLSALCVVDMGFAALAFWLLFPAELGISFQILLPVFLLATGVGILSGVPGGVGPFELTCMAFLPLDGQAPLLAVILGFRMIYYVLPGVLGFGMLAHREWIGTRNSPVPSLMAAPNLALPSRIRTLTDNAARAEARLIHTGDFGWLMAPSARAYLMVGEVGNSLVGLSDCVGDQGCAPDLLQSLKCEAKARNLSPVLYKCGAQTAKEARKIGFSTCMIGHEAVLDPQSYALEGRQMRGLRRKLKSSATAAIRVEACDNAVLPLGQMQAVSDAWSARRGGARGFSMGCFNQNDTRNHLFYLAWQGGRLVGFVGLWRTEKETALDLMRAVDDAPCGTMHALVHHAIIDAKATGRRRFSLASVPFSGLENANSLPEKACHWLYSARADWHGGPGLYQFKQSFRPDWKPRYLASRGVISTALAAVDISRRIQDC